MFHFHWFNEHHKTASYIYSECRCGKRRVLKLYYIHIYGPIDRDWLKLKERPILTSPNKVSGVTKLSIE